MNDYKLKLVQSIEEKLVTMIDKDSLAIVTNEITTILKDYNISKNETSLVVYEGANENLLKRFCACLLVEGKSEKTILQYKRTAEKFFMAINKNYVDVTVYDIRLFLAIEKQRGISNRTLANNVANISSFYGWMAKEEIITKNPCLALNPIKFPSKIRLPFSTLDIDAIRFACKTEKERAIVEVLLSSGVRVSELVNIRLNDIDFDNLSVHITRGKGNKERTVFISELTKTYILKYLNSRNINGDYLFYNKKKFQLNPGGVRSILKSIGERAGVENVHPHRFRRTFASNLACRGMDIQDIRKLLGHERIDTTLEYVHTSDKKIEISYKKYTL